MGKIKKIVNGVVVEVDEPQMVKTIVDGVVVEKPFSEVKKKEQSKRGFWENLSQTASAASQIGGQAGALEIPSIKSQTNIPGYNPLETEVQRTVKRNKEREKEQIVSYVNKTYPKLKQTDEQIIEGQQGRAYAIGRQKLDELIATPEGRQDPVANVKSAQQTIKDNPQEWVKNYLAGRYMEDEVDGVDASELLGANFFQGDKSTNQTVKLLSDKKDKYLSETEDLRSMAAELDTNGNAIFIEGRTPEAYEFDAVPRLEQAAFKWRLKTDKNFADEIKVTGRNNFENIPSYKRGETMEMFLNSPEVATYIRKENPDMIPAFDAAAKGLLSKNTDYGINVVANEISRKRQEEGLNNPIVEFDDKNFRNETDMVADILYANDPQKKAIYEKYIKPDPDKYLDTPSLLEGFAQGGKGVLQGIGNTFSEPFRSPSQSLLRSWDKEARNVSADPKGVSKFLSGTGHTLGLVATLGGTGKVLGAGGTGMYSKNIAPILSGGVLPFFGDMLEEGRKKYPTSPVKAWLSGATNTAMYAALSKQIFPSEKVAQAIKGVQPEVKNIVERLANGEITREVARQEANTAFKTAFDFVKGTVGGSAKIAGELTAISAFNRGLDKIMMDDEQFKEFHPDDELIDGFKTMFLDNLAVAGMSKYGEQKKNNRIAKETYYELASNPKMYERLINNLSVDKSFGTINEFKSNLDHIVKLKEQLNQEGFSPEAQKEFIFQSLREKVAKEQLESTTDNTLANKQKEVIKEAEAAKEEILAGKFKEPEGFDVENAEKGIIDQDRDLTDAGEQLSEDQQLLKTAIDNGEVTGMYADMANEAVKSPEAAKELIDMARSQATGEIARELGTAREGIEKAFGKTIADAVAPVKDQLALEDTKIVDKDGKPLTVFHSTYEKFDDFKDGVAYFAEDAEYSKDIAKTMNENGRASDYVEKRQLNTIPVKIKASRVYELPKGIEMNDNVIKDLLKDPEFVNNYDAVKGIDLYSENKIVYAVFDKNKIVKEQSLLPNKQTQTAKEGGVVGSGAGGDVNEGFKPGVIKRPSVLQNEQAADRWVDGNIQNETSETIGKRLNELEDLINNDKRISDTDKKLSLDAIQRKKEQSLPTQEVKTEQPSTTEIKTDETVATQTDNPALRDLESTEEYLDNYEVNDVEIPEGIENEIGWQEKLVDKAFSDMGVKPNKQVAGTGTIYYTFEGKDGVAVKVRLGDHSKGRWAGREVDANVVYDKNSSPQDVLDILRDELPDGKILKTPNKKQIKNEEIKPQDTEVIEQIETETKPRTEELPTEPIEEAKTETVTEPEGEPEQVRLTHADTEAIYDAAGLPLRLNTPVKHRDQLEKEAEERLKNGYDFDKVADETLNGDYKFEDTDQVLFARKVADLKAKQKSYDILSPEFDNLQKEIEKLSRASDVAGTIGGRFLESRKHYQMVDETLSDYVIAEKEDAGVTVLTDAQKETVQKEFKDIQEAQMFYEEKMNQLKTEYDEKLAQAEVAKMIKTVKKDAKKDFKKEREKIFEDIREKLKKARSETSAVAVPYLKELIAISPDVIKLAKSYIEQGVTELSEIVKNIKADIGDDNITERDIRGMIAGEYTEKKPTRNQLAEQVVNLKREAKLVNQLEDLLKGEVPKSEDRKRKVNKKIDELKEQIKSVKSLDKDVQAYKDAVVESATKYQEEISKDLSKAEKELSKEEAESKKVVKTEEQKKLGAYKTKLKNETERIEKQIRDNDYSVPEKKPPLKLDKEAVDLRDNLIKLKQRREARRLLVQRQKETDAQSGLRYFTEVLNIPRTLMTIGDFSGLLRQNLFFSVSHPLMTAKAIPGMFKSFTSQKVYDRWFADLEESPRYQIIKNSKLAIADSLSHDLSQREEAFMSTLAEKIPVIGQTLRNKEGKKIIPGLNIVKGSERSYTMLLNKMRVDVFNYFVDSLEKRGITYENSPRVYKAVAEYVNNATGRSDFGKHLNRIAPILNGIFFSPRLIASRVNMLTYWAQPRFWKTLPREVKIDYFRGWISLLGTGLTILALAQLGGADVEDDPRSSDFGKIKSGNTRWDIWGGAQPYVRVLAQVASGKRKSTTSGKIYDLSGDDIFGETRSGVVSDFFRNKLAPVPGMAVDMLSGRTGIGDKIKYQWGGAGEKEISIDQYIKQRLLPMTITGTQEAMKDQGVKSLLTVGLPNIFGIGTQTYEAPKPKQSTTNY